MVETSDISINCPGASLVALRGRHPISGPLEEAHWSILCPLQEPDDEPTSCPTGVAGVIFSQ
ncbi:hypothetical protein GTY87_27270 [Streptomyces sp. SID7813]|nr:hypothetical protein [Streptomyces sp. SID7813]QFI45211.1 hypothetical protein FQ762_27525 [Streptomyces coelicolor A3(2)]